MTRRLIAVCGIAAALGAGCTTTDDSYVIDAFAELAPLGAAGPQITGRLEVLSATQRGDSADYERAIAAHRVQLPAAASPWIRLWIAPACEPGAGQPMLYQDLGLIRQVGDDVHFFDRGVVVAGRTIDLDIGTATAAVTLDPVPSGDLFKLIAVAQAPGSEGGETTTEVIGGRVVPVGGAWLACGAFALTRR